MDINTASFIIAFLSLIVALPQFIKWMGSREPTIFLVVDSNINLFNQIVKSFDGLSVSYHNEPISKNSNLLKAFICYVGGQDIEKEKIIKTIRLGLPKAAKIIISKIIDQTEGLGLMHEVVSNNIDFKFDLLKNSDFFYFEIFFECDSVMSEKQFEIKSRISGIDNHMVVNYNIENYKLHVSSNYILFAGMIFFSILTSYNPIIARNAKDKTYGYEKIFYKNYVKVDLDSLYKEMKNFNKLDTSNLKNISKDSLNHLALISKDLQIFHSVDDSADSLLIILLNKKVDWSNVRTYNVFSSTSDIIRLSDNYSIQFRSIFHWLYLFYFSCFIAFILSMLSFYRYSYRYNKIQPAIDLIRTYKKNLIP